MSYVKPCVLRALSSTEYYDRDKVVVETPIPYKVVPQTAVVASPLMVRAAIELSEPQYYFLVSLVTETAEFRTHYLVRPEMDRVTHDLTWLEVFMTSCETHCRTDLGLELKFIKKSLTSLVDAIKANETIARQENELRLLREQLSGKNKSHNYYPPRTTPYRRNNRFRQINRGRPYKSKDDPSKIEAKNARPREAQTSLYGNRTKEQNKSAPDSTHKGRSYDPTVKITKPLPVVKSVVINVQDKERDEDIRSVMSFKARKEDRIPEDHHTENEEGQCSDNEQDSGHPTSTKHAGSDTTLLDETDGEDEGELLGELKSAKQTFTSDKDVNRGLDGMDDPETDDDMVAARHDLLPPGEEHNYYVDEPIVMSTSLV